MVHDPYVNLPALSSTSTQCAQRKVVSRRILLTISDLVAGGAIPRTYGINLPALFISQDVFAKSLPTIPAPTLPHRTVRRPSHQTTKHKANSAWSLRTTEVALLLPSGFIPGSVFLPCRYTRGTLTCQHTTQSPGIQLWDQEPKLPGNDLFCPIYDFMLSEPRKQLIFIILSRRYP